jgi:hypothetical protein
LVILEGMSRIALASAALALAAFSTGCGGYYHARYGYRARFMYAAPPPVVVAVPQSYEEPPEPPPPPAPPPAPKAAPAKPRTIVVRAPPGSTVIVNADGSTKIIRRKAPTPPSVVEPRDPEPSEPSEPAELPPAGDPGWSD